MPYVSPKPPDCISAAPCGVTLSIKKPEISIRLFNKHKKDRAVYPLITEPCSNTCIVTMNDTAKTYLPGPWVASEFGIFNHFFTLSTAL